jgi:hypothetical protein
VTSPAVVGGSCSSVETPQLGELVTGSEDVGVCSHAACPSPTTTDDGWTTLDWIAAIIGGIFVFLLFVALAVACCFYKTIFRISW